jgi:CRP-like cAMP-binding protein
VRWPLLDSISEAERAALLGASRLERSPRRRTIFQQGAKADRLYLIASGLVAVKQSLPDGEMAIVVVLGPGDAFGELALVAPAARSATVVAITECEVLKVPAEALRDLRRSNAGVNDLLVRSLVDEVRRLSSLLLEAHFLPVDERIRRRLDDVARLCLGERPGPVLIPLTQEELAQIAGTTRATVNRILRSAEAAGQVRLARGGVEILGRSAAPFNGGAPGKAPPGPPR